MMNLLDLKLGSLKSFGPEYSGAGEVPFEPLSESFSPFVSLLGVTQPEGESGRVLRSLFVGSPPLFPRSSVAARLSEE